MLRIEPGTFQMGSTDGERGGPGTADERPVHTVTLSQPFWMAATPITNAQYEQFDPAHRALRGKRGLSSLDDEAVLYVSWHEAVAFCEWLSEREGPLQCGHRLGGFALSLKDLGLERQNPDQT